VRMQTLFRILWDLSSTTVSPTKIGASHLTLNKDKRCASIKYLISSHLVPHSLVSNKGIVCHTMVIVIKNSNTPHPWRRRKTNCTIMHIEIGQLNLYQHSLSSLNLPHCKYKNETYQPIILERRYSNAG